MAVEIGELRARLTAEADGIKAEIRNVKKEISDLGEQGKKASKDLDPLNGILTQIGLNTEQLKKIEEQLKRLDTSKVEQGLSDIVNELKKMGVESKQVSAVEKSLSEVTQAAQEANSRIAKLEEELRQAGSTGQKEVTGISADLAKVGDEGGKAATSIKELRTSITNVSSAQKQIETLALSLDNINSRIELQRRKLAELRESYATTFNEAKKSKLEEQILRTEASLIKLTQSSDQTSQKIWALEDALNQAGQGGTEAASKLNALDSSLKEIGFNADQIKVIKRHLDEADPAKLDRQLDELSAALRKLGVDSKQIEKITNELRESEREAQRTKQSIGGLASGLAALGAGAATAKLANTIKTLSDEAQRLAMSYQGLTEVSKSFNVNQKESVGLAEELSDRWGLSRSELADTVKTYLTAGLTLDQTKNIITATADAAVYNREAHLSWGEAIKQVAQGIKMGNSDLTDAAGITTNLSVMYDRFAKSIGTTAGKLTEAGKIQAAYNGIMQESAMFAGNADSAMTGYTGTQATFSQTVEMARAELGEAFLPVLQDIMQELTPMIKGFVEWASENKEVVAGVAAATIAITGFIAIVGALSAAFIVLNSAMSGVLMIVTLVAAVAAGITAYGLAADKASGSVLRLANSQEELNTKLSESSKWTSGDLENARADIEELESLLAERQRLQQKMEELRSKLPDVSEASAGSMVSIDPELAKDIDEVQRSLDDVDKTLRKMDFETPEKAAEAVERMKDASKGAVNALLEEQDATFQVAEANNQRLKSLEAALQTYNRLSELQSLDIAQKQELKTATETLIAAYPDLHALMDSEGNLRIQNIDLAEEQIATERTMLDATLAYEDQRLESLQRTTEEQKKSVEAQIENYEKLMETLIDVINASDALNSVDSVNAEKLYMKNQDKGSALYSKQNSLQASLNDIKKRRASLSSGSIPSSGSGGNAALFDNSSDKKSKKKTGKTAAELAREQRQDAYDAAVATVQYQAEMYDWSAEKQIEAYEKIRKQHKQHLKETVEDERQLNLQIKRLQEDSVKSRFDFSSEWIGREERRMEESGKTEIEITQMKIDAWTRVRDRYDKDSEYYKKADDELYRNRKNLLKLQEQAEKEAAKAREERIKEHEKQNDDLLKTELKAIEKAKKAELDAIDQRKKEYIDAQDEKIAAIDALLKKEEELNADADYETLLAEKMARKDKLSTAVSPEGRKELADLIAEIERMQLEHSRELRKRDLEDQKDKLEEEKDEKEDAYDEERRLTEARYDALTEALQEHQDDIEFIESAIKNFRIGANQEANTQILSDLDLFVSEYRSRMSEISSLSAATGSGSAGSGGPASSQASLDLAEYNANKDAWDAAKARGDKAEMARLTARNEEIRKLYGIEKDTGKLPSFDVGGVVPGPIGAPMQAIIHGGEAIFNPGQFENMFRRLTAPISSPALNQPATPIQRNEYNFDMSVGAVTIEDQADAQILYTERERTARRLATIGGGK